MVPSPNSSISAFLINGVLWQSPIFLVGHSSKAFALRSSRFSRIVPTVLFSTGSAAICAKSISFSHHISTPIVVSRSVEGQSFSSRQDLSSNSTVDISSCTFTDITVASIGGAIFVSNSGSNVSIFTSTFVRCVSTLNGESAGGISIHNCYSVILVRDSYSYCSGNNDVATFHVDSETYTIYYSTVNQTTQSLSGTYLVSSSIVSICGGRTSSTFSIFNQTQCNPTSSWIGPGIGKSDPSNIIIQQLLISNCSRGSFLVTMEYSGSLNISRSNFVNLTVSSSGWVYSRSYASMPIFSKCNFVGVTNTALTSGVSGTYLTFINCCFDVMMSSAYQSGNSFISCLSGQCIFTASLSFTSISCPSACERHMFLGFLAVMFYS